MAVHSAHCEGCVDRWCADSGVRIGSAPSQHAACCDCSIISLCPFLLSAHTIHTACPAYNFFTYGNKQGSPNILVSGVKDRPRLGTTQSESQIEHLTVSRHTSLWILQECSIKVNCSVPRQSCALGCHVACTGQRSAALACGNGGAHRTAAVHIFTASARLAGGQLGARSLNQLRPGELRPAQG